jgi:hypothetical protein
MVSPVSGCHSQVSHGGASCEIKIQPCGVVEQLLSSGDSITGLVSVYVLSSEMLNMSISGT